MNFPLWMCFAPSLSHQGIWGLFWPECSECGEMPSSGANAVRFTFAPTCSHVSMFVCKRVIRGLMAGDSWISVDIPAPGVPWLNTESRLHRAHRLKEIEVSLGKRRSAAERAHCGRFLWSALGFRLSKVTLKAAAGKKTDTCLTCRLVHSSGPLLFLSCSSKKEQPGPQTYSL